MKRNYDNQDYQKFRLAVLKRDAFTCQMPTCKKRTNLNVHHIKTWAKASSLRYEPANGICLCKQCHQSINGKEHHYEKLFREIIDEKIQ